MVSTAALSGSPNLIPLSVRSDIPRDRREETSQLFPSETETAAAEMVEGVKGLPSKRGNGSLSAVTERRAADHCLSSENKQVKTSA